MAQYAVASKMVRTRKDCARIGGIFRAGGTGPARVIFDLPENRFAHAVDVERTEILFVAQIVVVGEFVEAANRLPN
jgi:hypothetical protein